MHYLCGHVLAFLTLVYALHLGLTSVCRPYMMFGLVLMTHDCNDVYLDVFRIYDCCISSIDTRVAYQQLLADVYGFDFDYYCISINWLNQF
ncbi:unnamed protein product [Leptidea sinapis]|uniref:Uncharacterized protein n=1 Tax=Leptidea sinapis TaxID=189913 RepID=A0A5E4QBI8_9NEOP|nr:unnamed protein product [Leptidea sinapis]